MTITDANVLSFRWFADARRPKPPHRISPTPPTEPRPLSAEDRAYLDHRFVRDWMISNPEALQTESGAMLLRTLYPHEI